MYSLCYNAQLCCCSVKAATDGMETNDHGCAPVRFLCKENEIISCVMKYYSTFQYFLPLPNLDNILNS